MKNNKKTFGAFYSPYSHTNNMVDCYEAYQKDPQKFIRRREKVYSKIIHRCEFYAYDGYTMLVALEATARLQLGDTLVDEDGREFVIKAFEMLHFSGEVPEWYFKISMIAIQGESYTIGKYLTKK